MPRLRVRFGRGGEVKFISHLDIVRFWERAFRRAEISLAHSQGFTHHPRISLAAPLPVGVTSEFELMDVWLKQWMPPDSFLMSVRKQLPPGFDAFEAWEVGLHLPSLQSSLAFAEYSVGVKTEKGEQEIQGSLDSMLQARQLPWQHSRGSKVHSYDLRALIDNLWIVSCHDALCILGMRLSCGTGGSGRAEQVVGALSLGDYPEFVHRTGLILR
jgi:radical SAM-linked protein